MSVPKSPFFTVVSTTGQKTKTGGSKDLEMQLQLQDLNNQNRASNSVNAPSQTGIQNKAGRSTYDNKTSKFYCRE